VRGAATGAWIFILRRGKEDMLWGEWKTGSPRPVTPSFFAKVATWRRDAGTVLVVEARNWRQATSGRVGAVMDIVIEFASVIVGSVL